MDYASEARVVRIGIERTELTAERVPALRELFGLERLPLAASHVEIELAGVDAAAANALRRALADEQPGYALQVPEGGWDAEATTDRFMLPQFVCGRIALLRLRPQLPAEAAATARSASRSVAGSPPQLASTEQMRACAYCT